MRKFDVGNRYRILDVGHSEYGNIIEITETYGKFVNYRTVNYYRQPRFRGVASSFSIYSEFAEHLKEVPHDVVREVCQR